MLKNDFYPCVVNASYSPAQLEFPKYCFHATLKRAEKEEAAARLISFCKEIDEWVGVTWQQIRAVMEAEFDLMKEQDEIRFENVQEKARVNQLRKIRYWLGICTFGIYTKYTDDPIEVLKDVPATTTDHTLIRALGEKPVVEGLNELINDGYVLYKRIKNDDVFYPTEKLAKAIEKFATN